MVTHYLLGRSGLYHRFDPKLPRKIALDDVKSLEELEKIGIESDMNETFEFVDKYFSEVDLNSETDTMITNSLDHATGYHSAWEETLNVCRVPIKSPTAPENAY